MALTSACLSQAGFSGTVARCARGRGGDRCPLSPPQIRSQSKASGAGLREGDEVVSINGCPCAGLSHPQVVELMEGVTDSLHLLVKRYGARARVGGASASSGGCGGGGCGGGGGRGGAWGSQVQPGALWKVGVAATEKPPYRKRDHLNPLHFLADGKLTWKSLFQEPH